MVRKYFLALAVLGAFFVIAAGVAQAGWGHSYESTQPGETMSADPEAELSPSEATSESNEGMETSEYGTEEAVETGRLPESGEVLSSSEQFDVNEFGGQPFREGIDDGP